MKLILYLVIVLSAGSALLVLAASKPTVDPGLFMIWGVETCRNGSGYCLLGVDCTLDDDFLPDDSNGHCEGLKNAFTPTAHFTCCKHNAKLNNTTETPASTSGTTTTAATTTTTTTTTTTSTTTENTPVLTTNTVKPSSEVFVDVNSDVIQEVSPPALVLNDTAGTLP